MFRDNDGNNSIIQMTSGPSNTESQYDPSKEYQNRWLLMGILLNVILSIDLGWIVLILTRNMLSYGTSALGIMILAILVLITGLMLHDLGMHIWLFALGLNGISIMSLFGIIFYQYLYIDPGDVLPYSILELLIPCYLGIGISVCIFILLLSPKISHGAFTS